MSDLFEYYNGVKMPSSKIITDFSDSLVIHFITVKNLEKIEKYKNKIKDIKNDILNSDNRDHVIIIFVNSIPIVNYDGYILILNDDKSEFINKPIHKSFILNNGKTIEPFVNGTPRFIEMQTCWNVLFKVSIPDIKYLSFACIDKTKDQIEKEFEDEIKDISLKAKIKKDQVISKLTVCSKRLDYYDFENTIETKFFKEDPNLIDLIDKYDSIHIINSESSLLETFIPSLIYTIISIKESIKIYISGKYIKTLLYRFKDNLFTFESFENTLKENTLEKNKENTLKENTLNKSKENTLKKINREESMITIICSNTMMSNNESCVNTIEQIRKYKNLLLYTNEKIKYSTEISKYIRTIYEPYVIKSKINKQFIQEDDVHFVLDGVTYFNIINSYLNIKSILFTNECKSLLDINIKSSLKSLQRIASLMNI